MLEQSMELAKALSGVLVFHCIRWLSTKSISKIVCKLSA